MLKDWKTFFQKELCTNMSIHKVNIDFYYIDLHWSCYNLLNLFKCVSTSKFTFVMYLVHYKKFIRVAYSSLAPLNAWFRLFSYSIEVLSVFGNILRKELESCSFKASRGRDFKRTYDYASSYHKCFQGISTLEEFQIPIAEKRKFFNRWF